MVINKEIAIFGGTFDPPTRAHEAIVQACLDVPFIDEVWLMPSGQRRDKPEMSSEIARVAMVQLMIAEAFHDDARLRVCHMERYLPQPTSTAQTYVALRDAYPATSFWFIFGADSYHDMPNWKQGRVLRRNMSMLIMEREGFKLPPETETKRHLPLYELEHPISSTQARHCAKTGLDLAPFVQPTIGNFISRAALYT